MSRSKAEARMDWLAVTVKGSPESLVRHELGKILGVEGGKGWELQRSGKSGYSTRYRGPHGVEVLSSGCRPECHFIVPGGACAALHPGQHFALQMFAERYGKVTRLDVALDDYERRMGPLEVRKEFQGPGAVTRAKRCKRTDDATRQGQLEGEGITIGVRGGECLLRVYDKGLESDGVMDCVRWEIEARGRVANIMLSALAGGADAGEVFSEHLVRFLDFRVPGPGPKRAWQRAAWFEDLVGDAKAAPLPQPVQKCSVKRAIVWLRRQASPWLRTLLHLCEGDAYAVLRALQVPGSHQRLKQAHAESIRQGPAVLLQALQELDHPKDHP